jgi:hypothetical protein
MIECVSSSEMGEWTWEEELAGGIWVNCSKP